MGVSSRDRHKTGFCIYAVGGMSTLFRVDMQIVPMHGHAESRRARPACPACPVGVGVGVGAGTWADKSAGMSDTVLKAHRKGGRR